MPKTYTKEVMFADETIAEIYLDGLMYRFRPEDITDKLKDLPNDCQGWFFNYTRDRYCAEWESCDKWIGVNPSKVVELFGMPVIM